MGRRKGKGKSVKKNAHRPGHGDEEDTLLQAPHSFVVPLGKTGKCVRELAADFRKVMEPFTASNVKARPGNVIKDYVHVAGVLNVSHLVGFTKTDLGPYIKFARFPRGPTLTFRINEYIMGRDVRSNLKRQITYDKQFLHAPLLIMNGFSGENRELQLTSSMFQNMFPSINVAKVKLNTIKRCVLLNRDEETGNIEFRHYTIKVVPVGLSKGVKKIVTGKIPNLGRFEDMSEFLTNKGPGSLTSDSEGEEDESSRVMLPQAVTSRGNLPQEQSSVRLVELGPRINMKLIKIEEGLFDGEVMYHSHVQKTEEEKKAIRISLEKRKKEKEKRQKEQALNVKKKEDEKLKNKKKSLAGMQKNLKLPEEVPKGFEGLKTKDPNAEEEEEEKVENNRSDDDDEEYFRQEVGQAPDKDLFDKTLKRRSSSRDVRFKKKRRMNTASNTGGGSSAKFSKFKKDGGGADNNGRKPFKKNSSNTNPKARFKITMNKKSRPPISKKKIHSKKKSK